MDALPTEALIESKYREVFGAAVRPGFATYLDHAPRSDCMATLGYRRAGCESLGLEIYLDEPIEKVASAAFARSIERAAIVEIGNFAAANAFAMIDLWGAAANDLGASSEVAVATLTEPLRRIFARIGVPIVELANADPARIGGGSEWGRYYDHDPKVCAGVIVEGQDALARFHARRGAKAAA